MNTDFILPVGNVAKIYTISTNVSGTTVKVNVKDVVPNYDKLTAGNFFIKSVRMNPYTTANIGILSITSYSASDGMVTATISGGSIFMSGNITIVCVVGVKEVAT